MGSKKDGDSDASIPIKAIDEGIVTPNTATDIDSSGVWHALAPLVPELP